MALKVDPMKCTGCRVCEFACNYHHDGSISPIGSSLMYYYEEKEKLLRHDGQAREIAASGSA